MAGELGLPGKRLEFNGEQLVLEPLTSDPASTEEGDWWFRSDLAPETDQIGTIRFDNGSTIDSIPIFATGTSDTGVEEVFRPFDGVNGYIPITADSPEFPHLGFQHDGTRYGLHNAVTPIPAGVIDNFEDADSVPAGVYETGQTVADYYGGDLSNFARQTGTVQEASTALEATGTTGNVSISSTSGLNTYPAQGDTFRCWVRTSHSTGGCGVLYATQSESGSGSISGYLARVEFGVSQIKLYRGDNGSFTELDAAAVSPSANTWYEIEVEWTTGDGHTFRLLNASGSELASVSATDATYTSGGVGFRQGNKNGTSESSFYDGFRIVS